MNIRLEPWEVEQICSAFENIFDSGDRLWLFGSRTNLEKRGGDIDLYIELAHFEISQAWDKRDLFWEELQNRLGDQAIDIVICDPKKDLPIYAVARSEGVLMDKKDGE